MAFTMKKGGGTANADTEGTFSTSDSNTLNKLKVKAFMDPGAPEGFKANAPEVVGKVVRVSAETIKSKDSPYSGYPTVRDVKGEVIPNAGRWLSREVDRNRKVGTRPTDYTGMVAKDNIKDVTGRTANEFLVVKTKTKKGNLTFSRPMFK